jgi:hypothetical protein
LLPKSLVNHLPREFRIGDLHAAAHNEARKCRFSRWFRARPVEFCAPHLENRFRRAKVSEYCAAALSAAARFLERCDLSVAQNSVGWLFFPSMFSGLIAFKRLPQNTLR